MRVLVVLGVAVATLAGCATVNNPRAAPSADATSTSYGPATSAATTSILVRPASEALADGSVAADLQRLQSDDDPDAVVMGSSDSDFHHQNGPSKEVALSRADRQLLKVQLRRAREFAVAHPRLRDATAEGYVAQDFVDADGVHVTNWALVNPTFDPGHPSMIVYESAAPDAKIVTLSYVVESKGRPPDGFAGPNDRWHQHFGLCVKDGAIRQDAMKNRPYCEQLGGRYLSGTTLWMLHAWVVPGMSNPWGTFAIENPNHSVSPSPEP